SGQRTAKMSPSHRAERLVRALENSLRSDVDPRPGGHLPVHRETESLELAEFFPRSPPANEVAVRDKNARSRWLRTKDGDGRAALHEQSLVRVEPPKRRDDCVERLPGARSAPRPTVHHEIVRTLRNLRIEVVHEHSKRGFLLPTFTRDRSAARRTYSAR